MPNRYQVSTFDICADGMNRMRNRDEILTCAFASPELGADDLRDEWKRDIRNRAWSDDDDDEAAICAAIDSYVVENGGAIAAELCTLDPVGDDEEGLSAFLYIRDVEAER